nr:hypothetical protein [uncultured Campylobacter sp.]
MKLNLQISASNLTHRNPHSENVKFANLVSYEINIPDVGRRSLNSF